MPLQQLRASRFFFVLNLPRVIVINTLGALFISTQHCKVRGFVLAQWVQQKAYGMRVIIGREDETRIRVVIDIGDVGGGCRPGVDGVEDGVVVGRVPEVLAQVAKRVAWGQRTGGVGVGSVGVGSVLEDSVHPEHGGCWAAGTLSEGCGCKQQDIADELELHVDGRFGDGGAKRKRKHDLTLEILSVEVGCGPDDHTVDNCSEAYVRGPRVRTVIPFFGLDLERSNATPSTTSRIA